jgi:hypothetical protein
VDLPDPDGPITARKSPSFNIEIDAVEGMDDLVAHDEITSQILGADIGRQS